MKNQEAKAHAKEFEYIESRIKKQNRLSSLDLIEFCTFHVWSLLFRFLNLFLLELFKEQ